MPIDAPSITAMIESELRHVTDQRVRQHIGERLVEPKALFRAWDYGAPGQQYQCWDVLIDAASSTAITYCEDGFGPRNPWGLVPLQRASDPPQSMGMDSGWFPTFVDAYFDSFASTRLPIYRVFKTGLDGTSKPVTGEASWDDTWKLVEDLRERDPKHRYDVGHGMAYRRKG